jgi:hypothetical protein
MPKLEVFPALMFQNINLRVHKIKDPLLASLARHTGPFPFSRTRGRLDACRKFGKRHSTLTHPSPSRVPDLFPVVWASEIHNDTVLDDPAKDIIFKVVFNATRAGPFLLPAIILRVAVGDKDYGQQTVIPLANHIGHPVLFRFRILDLLHFVYDQQRHRAKRIENLPLFCVSPVTSPELYADLKSPVNNAAADRFKDAYGKVCFTIPVFAKHDKFPVRVFGKPPARFKVPAKLTVIGVEIIKCRIIKPRLNAHIPQLAYRPLSGVFGGKLLFTDGTRRIYLFFQAAEIELDRLPGVSTVFWADKRYGSFFLFKLIHSV